MEECIGGLPKIRGTFLGVPYKKGYSILWSILGSPIWENYHMRTLIGIHIQLTCRKTCDPVPGPVSIIPKANEPTPTPCHAGK